MGRVRHRSAASASLRASPEPVPRTTILTESVAETCVGRSGPSFGRGRAAHGSLRPTARMCVQRIHPGRTRRHQPQHSSATIPRSGLDLTAQSGPSGSRPSPSRDEAFTRAGHHVSGGLTHRGQTPPHVTLECAELLLGAGRRRFGGGQEDRLDVPRGHSRGAGRSLRTYRLALGASVLGGPMLLKLASSG